MGERFKYAVAEVYALYWNFKCWHIYHRKDDADEMEKHIKNLGPNDQVCVVRYVKA